MTVMQKRRKVEFLGQYSPVLREEGRGVVLIDHVLECETRPPMKEEKDDRETENDGYERMSNLERHSGGELRKRRGSIERERRDKGVCFWRWADLEVD